MIPYISSHLWIFLILIMNLVFLEAGRFVVSQVWEFWLFDYWVELELMLLGGSASVRCLTDGEGGGCLLLLFCNYYLLYTYHFIT